MNQLTNQIFMIRPACFGYNAETAVNNAFQTEANAEDYHTIQRVAVEEFDHMVSLLRSKGIHVLVIEDTAEPLKPDAVFPNNWISFHENGTVITYPMFAKNRRIERRPDIIESISSQYFIKNKYSFEFYEEDNIFLEGTGSMIFDRSDGIVYACLSPRTNLMLIDKFNLLMNTRSIVFEAVDEHGHQIYHTNVMMALGLDFVVICMDSIQNLESKQELYETFKKTGKDVIHISHEQMNAFAGNMLEIRGHNDQRYLVLSQTAYNVLKKEQIANLESHTTLLPIPIPTIETYGGGSVRCMMAEIFLDKK
ncbi:MAG: arginine deiminase-related protein [Saprospiraceae bacterium]